MGKHELNLIAVMAFLMMGDKGIERALKDERNSACNPRRYNPNNNRYREKSPGCPSYSGSRRLFYRKII